jgi:glycine dehydrogenase
LSRGQGERTVCLIPTSAHGTNPASAQMVGMEVIAVKCDGDGNVDTTDLRTKAKQYGPKLAAMMITYPSTHGVFESAIRGNPSTSGVTRGVDGGLLLWFGRQ